MKTFSESAKIYAASVAEEPVPNKIERQNLFLYLCRLRTG